MSTKAVQKLELQELLKRHQLHDGLYSRVAKKLRVDASYVSRVARGKRESLGVVNALVEELRRIERL